MLRADGSIVREWLREEEEEEEEEEEFSCPSGHKSQAVLMRATIEQLVAACAEAAGKTLVSIMIPCWRCFRHVHRRLANMLVRHSLVAAVHSSMAVNQVRLHEELERLRKVIEAREDARLQDLSGERNALLEECRELREQLQAALEQARDAQAHAEASKSDSQRLETILGQSQERQRAESSKQDEQRLRLELAMATRGVTASLLRVWCADTAASKARRSAISSHLTLQKRQLLGRLRAGSLAAWAAWSRAQCQTNKELGRVSRKQRQRLLRLGFQGLLSGLMELARRARHVALSGIYEGARRRRALERKLLVWRGAAAGARRLRVAENRAMLAHLWGLAATAWTAWCQFVGDGLGSEDEVPGVREARCLAVKDWLVAQTSAAQLQLALARVCCPAPCTLHPTPYTLHPTPYTLHPTPYRLHHTLTQAQTSSSSDAPAHHTA